MVVSPLLVLSGPGVALVVVCYVGVVDPATGLEGCLSSVPWLPPGVLAPSLGFRVVPWEGLAPYASTLVWGFLALVAIMACSY